MTSGPAMIALYPASLLNEADIFPPIGLYEKRRDLPPAPGGVIAGTIRSNRREGEIIL
jgi:hypothetical protein